MDNVNPFTELNKEFDLLINETDDIQDLLYAFQENNIQLKCIEKRDKKIREKVKCFLKERQWKDYNDLKSKIHVKLEQRKRKSYDTEQLKEFLTESQLAQITRISSYEILNFITQKERTRLKQIVRKKKK